MPAPFRDQQAWLCRWQDAMAKMHYLDVKHLQITESLRTLISIRGQLRKPNLNLELIEPDVEKLWREATAKATEASHVICKCPEGFECKFYAIFGNSYITGSVAIHRCA